jgi:hypothetical protein
MTQTLPKIAYVSPHCVLDFTNGAATAYDASVTFQNLPQTPTLTRSYVIYATWPSDAIEYYFSDSGSGGTGGLSSYGGTYGDMSFTPIDASNTPLGNGWYELGILSLDAADLTSEVTVTTASGGSDCALKIDQEMGQNYLTSKPPQE